MKELGAEVLIIHHGLIIHILRYLLTSAKVGYGKTRHKLKHIAENIAME